MFASPGFLLIAVGGLLGIYFPLGRLAREAGIAPLVWATLISIGAGSILLFWMAARGRAMPITRQYLRYFAVTGLVSYAIPNALIFGAIPHLGSGLTAMSFTLSPLLTVMLSRLCGLRAPSALEYAGIAIGFVGALLVASGRGQIGQPASWLWLLAGFCIPLSLAVGNVYRSLDWPRGADPAWLAVGSHAVAAGLLVAACVVTQSPFGALLALPWAALAQAVASAIMIVLFFQLQAIAGAVTVSQVGTVAAGVGILIGAAFMGERYGANVWLGVMVIAVALALTIVARTRELRGAHKD